MTKHIFSLQDGDVIELCQVSDIRAGGTPKVSQYIYICHIYTGTVLFDVEWSNNPIGSRISNRNSNKSSFPPICGFITMKWSIYFLQ